MFLPSVADVIELMNGIEFPFHNFGAGDGFAQRGAFAGPQDGFALIESFQSWLEHLPHFATSANLDQK